MKNFFKGFRKSADVNEIELSFRVHGLVKQALDFQGLCEELFPTNARPQWVRENMNVNAFVELILQDIEALKDMYSLLDGTKTILLDIGMMAKEGRSGGYIPDHKTSFQNFCRDHDLYSRTYEGSYSRKYSRKENRSLNKCAVAMETGLSYLSHLCYRRHHLYSRYESQIEEWLTKIKKTTGYCFARFKNQEHLSDSDREGIVQHTVQGLASVRIRISICQMAYEKNKKDWRGMGWISFYEAKSSFVREMCRFLADVLATDIPAKWNCVDEFSRIQNFFLLERHTMCDMLNRYKDPEIPYEAQFFYCEFSSKISQLCDVIDTRMRAMLSSENTSECSSLDTFCEWLLSDQIYEEIGIDYDFYVNANLNAFENNQVAITVREAFSRLESM